MEAIFHLKDKIFDFRPKYYEEHFLGVFKIKASQYKLKKVFGWILILRLAR